MEVGLGIFQRVGGAGGICRNRTVLFVRRGILITARTRRSTILSSRNGSSIVPAAYWQGILETMAFKRDRINIEVVPSSNGPETDQNDPARADAAIRSLARLIGRQIAREQFERKMALEQSAETAIRE